MLVQVNERGSSTESHILQHGLRRIHGRAKASKLANAMRRSRASAERSENEIQSTIDLAQALLDGGRITEGEYLLYATHGIEYLHDKRWFDHKYPEVEAISREMQEIERAADLKDNEFWLLADAPPEYQALADRYSAALDARFAEMLDKFGLPDLAQLWRTNRQEYDRQRESARLAIFEPNDTRKAVSHSIKTYETEAELSANAGAYYAACVTLGSAAEARLLAMCLNNVPDVSSVLATLRRAEAPRNSDPLHWNLEHLVLVAEHAGWIAELEDDFLVVNVAQWLLSLRDTRNLLHPGRHARDRPHVIMGPEAYTDARLAYQALCMGLERHMIAREASQRLPTSDDPAISLTEDT